MSFDRLQRAIDDSAHSDDRRDLLMIAVEGIVAQNDDPKHMHRVRVVIPSIDDELVYDEWVTAMIPFCGEQGYGPVHLPAIGSEVLLFGRLGDVHTLFYLSRFNEDFGIPGEFYDGSRGLKTETAYKLLADLFIQIVSQTIITLQAAERADVDSPDIFLRGGGGVSLRAQGSKIAFLGALPIARQTLPGPATDLGSCIMLANAIRQLLITFGLAQ